MATVTRPLQWVAQSIPCLLRWLVEMRTMVHAQLYEDGKWGRLSSFNAWKDTKPLFHEACPSRSSGPGTMARLSASFTKATDVTLMTSLKES